VSLPCAWTLFYPFCVDPTAYAQLRFHYNLRRLVDARESQLRLMPGILSCARLAPHGWRLSGTSVAMAVLQSVRRLRLRGYRSIEEAYQELEQSVQEEITARKLLC
jgi:hypothetical protein